MGNKRKIVKNFIIFVVIFIFLLMLFKFSSKLVVNIPFLQVKSEVENPLKRYKTVVKTDGNTHYISFKNVIGTSSEGSKTVYYNMDLTIASNSDSAKKNISANNAYAVETIRKTLSEFRQEDVSNEQGRQYLKNRLQSELNKVYGDDAVNEVYIEKFLYQ